MWLKEKFFFCLIIILLSKSVTDCHISTYIMHAPHIVLLGDQHAFWPSRQLELSHLAVLFKKFVEKKAPSTVLVEDHYAEIQKKLKFVTPDYLKKTLLFGLIERINSIKHQNLRTICIDRGNVLSRALFFPRYYETYPVFWDLSPKRLARDTIVNGYTLRFSDLIAEVKQLQKELDERRTSKTYDVRTHTFINSMVKRIDEQLCQLYKILAEHMIKDHESILETAIRCWVLRTINEHQDRASDIVKVSHELEDFIRDYTRNMTSEQWQQKTEELRTHCSYIFEPREQYHKDPSFGERLTSFISSSPIVKNWFLSAAVSKQVAQEEEDKAIAWPAICSKDPLRDLYNCFLQLRLLVVDSHATLDVIDNQGSDVVVVSGDAHIRNITRYLSELGFEQTICEIREQKMHEEPLKLEELLI